MGISFGSEGGGGRAAFSPRNHTYIFEVESGTYIDIMASSNQNMKLFLEIYDGYNQQVRRLNYLLDHGSFVGKVDAKGVCKLRVLTGEPNDVGQYNLEIFGKFIKKPERILSQEQKSPKSGHAIVSSMFIPFPPKLATIRMLLLRRESVI